MRRTRRRCRSTFIAGIVAAIVAAVIVAIVAPVITSIIASVIAAVTAVIFTWIAFVTAVVVAAVVTRVAASAVTVAFTRDRAAVGDRVADFNLLWEERRECRADRILLRLYLSKASRKYAELHRNNDFLFACYAERDDEIAADFTVCADAEISSHIVCCQSRFAGNVAEFCETRQKCGVVNRRHTHFKEVCKYEWLRLVSNIYLGAYCEYRFVVASVA